VFVNLYALARKTGVAALIATHNLDLARHMDRVFALKDGHLEERPKASAAAQPATNHLAT
jgi:lipoprotein-releasing system ATP-binding protein